MYLVGTGQVPVLGQVLRLRGCRGGFDATGEGAVGKARYERVAGGDLVGGANDIALLIEDQCIAAVENGERRKGVQLGVERRKSVFMGLEQALGSAVQVVPACLQAFAGLGECLAGVVAQYGCAEGCNSILPATKLPGDGVLQAAGELVQALGAAMEQGGDASFGAADGQMREMLARLQQLETDGAVEAMRLVGEILGDVVLGFGDEFGGG